MVTYSSGSGTSTLTLNYTVAAPHLSNDLDYFSTTALALNGGTIKDAATNNADLTVVAPGASGSLGTNKDIVIYVPTPFSITYSGQGTFNDNLTATGLAPGSVVQPYFHYSTQSGHENLSADGNGEVNFFDTAGCTYLGPSDPLLGVAVVGTPSAIPQTWCSDSRCPTPRSARQRCKRLVIDPE